MPIRCQLLTSTRDARAEQIHTGLSLLHKRGTIRLTQTLVERDSQGHRAAPRRDGSDCGFVNLRVDDSLTLHFDLADGDEIDLSHLETCDIYFKRGFRTESIPGEHSGRVLPLGLNFPIFPDFRDRFSLSRILQLCPWSRMPAELIRWMDTGNRFTHLPRVSRFGRIPNLSVAPRALFLVRAWDPYADPDRPPEKVAEFEAVNETRAACIRELRREFGDRFLGGFSHTEFAKDHYGDVLAPDHAITAKRNYLDLVDAYPVCIATTGLHGSIGWKLGEYMALGRAVVSEELQQFPGMDLIAARNYLEFRTPTECAESVDRLFQDDSLRKGMMLINLEFYENHGRPDRIVLNAILKALNPN